MRCEKLFGLKSGLLHSLTVKTSFISIFPAQALEDHLGYSRGDVRVDLLATKGDPSAVKAPVPDFTYLYDVSVHKGVFQAMLLPTVSAT